jgi:hypothetical protein
VFYFDIFCSKARNIMSLYFVPGGKEIEIRGEEEKR